MLQRTLWTIALCAVPAAASAQQAAANDADEGSVTTSARAPMRSFEVERSENVVPAEEIRRRQAKSITDALDDEPGILVQSTNRGAGTLILRGLVGPENLIYFDGVRFNQSTFRTGPNQYLDTVDPWALQRIEVVRGPGSVLYGSGAMGGVVQLVPRSLPSETEAMSRFSFESADNGAGAMLEAGGASDGFSARAGGSYRRHGRLDIGSNARDEDFFLTAAQGDEFLAVPYNEGYWRSAVGYDFGDQLVRVNYYGGVVDDAMRLDRLGDGEVRIYDNQDHLAYATYELDGPSWIDELRVNVSFHRTIEDTARFNCGTVAISNPRADELLDRVASAEGCVARETAQIQRQRRNYDRVDTMGSSATGVTRLLDERLSIVWGGDAYTDSVTSELEDARAPDFEVETKRGNFADGSTFTSVGLFGLARYDVWSSGSHLFRAHAGMRAESFAANAPDVTTEIGDVAYSFVGVVGSAGVAYLNGTNLNTYLNWNQGFRAPNLQESTVLGDSGNFYEVPNPDLGPERSDTFELGAKIDWPDALRLQPALWVSLISDRITREPTTFDGQNEIDGKEVRHRVNRDSAYFYGFDLGAETRAWSGVSFYGNLSFVDGAVAAAEEDPTFIAGPFHGLLGTADFYQNPRRLPPVQYLAGIRYDPDEHWYFAFYGQGAGSQDKLGPDDLDDERICEADVGVLHSELGQACPGNPGWLTLNARAGYRYENMIIDVLAENLTDERYRRYGSGVPGAGFNIAAMLSLEY